MSFSARAIEVLLASPFVIFIAHIAVARLRPRANPQANAFTAVVLAYAPIAALFGSLVRGLSVPAEAWTACVYAFLVYTAIGHCYFILFTMSETARRVRLLHEINAAGSARAEDLLKSYDEESLVSVRLDRLVGMGQIEMREGRYRIKGHFLYYAALGIKGWRSILGFPTIGSY